MFRVVLKIFLQHFGDGVLSYMVIEQPFFFFNCFASASTFSVVARSLGSTYF